MKRWMFVAALCLLPVLAWSAPKPKKSKPLPVAAETAVHTQHSVSIDDQTGRYDERFSSLE
ncbi:MAG: hypothetical protein ACREPY_13585, partial [Rhodanobacteraceae bacterium]